MKRMNCRTLIVFIPGVLVGLYLRDVVNFVWFVGFTWALVSVGVIVACIYWCKAANDLGHAIADMIEIPWAVRWREMR